MGIEDFVKGKYKKEYFKKHGTLPNLFDTVGRMPEEEQEKILKKALETNKTWRQVAKQPCGKDILF